jgi:D-cysteine desulfhydrase
VTGSIGYLTAVSEIAAQIRAGSLPPPDVLVAVLGSGGTVAGLLAGVVIEDLKTRVVGVSVASGPRIGSAMVLRLAWLAARRIGRPVTLHRLRAALRVDGRELGAGYGHPTARGSEATRVAAAAGIGLDSTYTAKAFAASLSLVGCPGFEGERPEIIGLVPQDRPIRVLYWHTLSRATPPPISSPGDLPARYRALLVTR